MLHSKHLILLKDELIVDPINNKRTQKIWTKGKSKLLTERNRYTQRKNNYIQTLITTKKFYFIKTIEDNK